MLSTYEAKMKARAQRRNARLRLRLRVLCAYSNDSPTCACCGETRQGFLCLDHIDGGGGRHRREVGGTTTQFYRLLEDTGFPPGYRVLCHNCNLALGFYGYCPHTQPATTPVVGEYEVNSYISEEVERRVNEITNTISEIVKRLSEQRLKVAKQSAIKLPLTSAYQGTIQQPLTAAHQAAIQQGVNLLHDGLGAPHAAIYNDLRHQFRVAKYDQIADAR